MSSTIPDKLSHIEKSTINNIKHILGSPKIMIY